MPCYRVLAASITRHTSQKLLRMRANALRWSKKAFLDSFLGDFELTIYRHYPSNTNFDLEDRLKRYILHERCRHPFFTPQFCPLSQSHIARHIADDPLYSSSFRVNKSIRMIVFECSTAVFSGVMPKYASTSCKTLTFL